MRIIHITLVAVFVGVILVFSFQNVQSVTVSFLGFRMSSPLSVLIIAVYLLGMATGGSVVSSVRRSIRKATRSEWPASPS